jgi:c-di-GMP-binding flagellar brake protein YcgR
VDMLTINQKIELRVLHGPYAGAYNTYVEDVDGQAITVVRPRVGGESVPLVVGDFIRVEYALRGLARISFPTRVLGLEDQVLPVLRLSVPAKDEVERFQQRDFVRLDANLNLIYYVISHPGRLVHGGGVIRSTTRDVSGNGAQILCPESYPSGTQLDIHLDVADRVIHTVGEVVRLVEQPGLREYWMGVRFVGLDERDRDVIIRFIFGEQRERRRRGLL